MGERTPWQVKQSLQGKGAPRVNEGRACGRARPPAFPPRRHRCNRHNTSTSIPPQLVMRPQPLTSPVLGLPLHLLIRVVLVAAALLLAAAPALQAQHLRGRDVRRGGRRILVRHMSPARMPTVNGDGQCLFCGEEGRPHSPRPRPASRPTGRPRRRRPGAACRAPCGTSPPASVLRVWVGGGFSIGLAGGRKQGRRAQRWC